MIVPKFLWRRRCRIQNQPCGSPKLAELGWSASPENKRRVRWRDLDSVESSEYDDSTESEENGGDVLGGSRRPLWVGGSAANINEIVRREIIMEDYRRLRRHQGLRNYDSDSDSE